ncbi:MAG: indolepyruvate ferredoxin oxidoreductase subunit alpha [Oscillospiraceae bacterium]|nr:indolepyruvate ferredoxin oxidoreductase subunit alpha [Oscillospiraceae bacterium]
MSEKKLLLGNAAIARGLYEAGCRFVSSYPGTPSTEITQFASEYKEIYAEWAPNEKVGAEAALGASIGGARAFCGMKHVGLNVAADPVFSAGYVGVNGGFVIAVADDSGMHSSQDEQDSRHYAAAAKIPMLEPSDSSECLSFTKKAFELSERFDTPFLIRSSTRISHSLGAAELGEREETELKEYKKDAAKYVMMPANARERRAAVEKRLAEIAEWAESCEFNRVEYSESENKTEEKIGIISSGIAYQYAREAFGDNCSYLKLGLVYPLPTELILDFAKNVDRVIVIEELDDIIESWCKKIGVKTDGKNLLSNTGEYSQEILREKILGIKPENIELGEDIAIPGRPPVLCPGCSHRGMFHVLKKLKLFVSGDIGCYTLGAAAPLSAMDTTLCMGASISGMHGFNVVRGAESAKKSVAAIGDSTFMHSGITGLIDITYNKGVSKILILDNGTTGMTGHQHHPGTGYTLKGEAAPIVSIEGICRAAGIKEENIKVFDPCDLTQTEKILKEELAKDEACVMIARRPCVLLKTTKTDKKYKIKQEGCTGCRLCMSAGCPAIKFENKKASVEESLCTGCGLCGQLCRLNLIEEI